MGQAPDFVGVGTNKCGTTWWHRLLTLHPQVHRAEGTPKELHHFDPFWRLPFTAADVAAYHAHFEPPPGCIAGEWTPRYAADAWVAPLLHAAAPASRWLLVLRDPWDRYVSELTAALAGRGAAGGEARLPAVALSRSRYGEQLRRVLAHHPAEQLLVLQYEACVADPVGQYRRTTDFLGLDRWDPDPAELTRPVNATGAPPLELPAATRDGVLAALADDLAEALELAEPWGLDPSRWPSVRSP